MTGEVIDVAPRFNGTNLLATTAEIRAKTQIFRFVYSVEEKGSNK